MENTRIYKKHKNCEMIAVLGPFGPHYAKLVCKKHNKTVQWLSCDQYTQITEGK